MASGPSQTLAKDFDRLFGKGTVAALTDALVRTGSSHAATSRPSRRLWPGTDRWFSVLAGRS